MSFTVSELQSIIKKNSNHIAKIEDNIRKIKGTIRDLKNINYNVPPQFYSQIERYRKEIKLYSKNQVLLKREMALLLFHETYIEPSILVKQAQIPAHIPICPTQIGNSALENHPPQNGIGDVNSTVKGSGARYNSGKPDLSLIPINTLEDEARVWEYGKKKYAAWNWAKGMVWSVPLACALRHIGKFQAGEQNDEESGHPHLAHAICNLRMLTHYTKFFPEGDDRPSSEYFL